MNWTAGTEVVIERNDKWNGGPLPKVRRIVWRMVPSAGNRRALLERGDADISYDLPNKDFVELKDAGKLNIVSTPYSNGIQYIGMNVKKPPFDNLEGAPGGRLRDPVPEDHGRGAVRAVEADVRREAGTPTEVAWPQAHTLHTDIAKAKQLLAEAGYPNGFETTLSFDLGFAGVNEPLCVLVQESLGADRHQDARSTRSPGANWRTELNKKVLPLYTNVFSGWLDYPEYFFIWCYHGKNSIFNTMSYQSKELDAMIDGAVDAAAVGDKAKYEKNVKGFVDLAFADMPRIPLFQPYCQRRDAEERQRLPVLVPPPARLSRAGEGVKMASGDGECANAWRVANAAAKAWPYCPATSPFAHSLLRLRRDERSTRPMLIVIAKRLLIAIPSLIGVVIVTFLLTRALPGDPAAYFAGPAATKEAIQEIRVKLGLDKSLPQQFVRYVGDLAKGDLGQSLTTGQPVVTEIRNRLPASAELTLLGLIVSVAIAIPLGIFAAVQAELVDRPHLPRGDDRRRVAAGVLHRPDPGLRRSTTCSAGRRRRSGGSIRSCRRRPRSPAST